VTRRRLGLPLGAIFFLLLIALPAPAGLSEPGWRTAAVGILMAVWWVSEAIPIPATALLPLVLFPLLGVAPIERAAAPFANPIIYLFLGGFLLALGMQRWGLPRRIALHTIRLLGTRPRSLVLGIMVSSAFLSMWVSNTATAMMMLPIGLSVVDLLPGGRMDPEKRRFGAALMLGIAYSCSIGGLATLVGTPPNAFLAAFLLESYGIQVGFAQWMLIGVPVAVVGLPVTYWILTRRAYRIPDAELSGGAGLLDAELARLGPTSRSEWRVAVVFAATAAAWILRPLLDDWLPGLSDAGVAMTGALALFLLPAGRGERPAVHRGGLSPEESEKRFRLLDWTTAEDLPWGVLVLFGGGLSLASAVQATGLDLWIGSGVGSLAALPVPLLMVIMVIVVVLLTELTSNTATAAAFLPVLGGVAEGIGGSPVLFAVPAALAASCAFLLPVATPPNAIVFGSEYVTIPEMVKAGIRAEVFFVLVVTLAGWLLAPVLFAA
jgi:sodium-dependent dicarboxylate transporter 2/3/5